MQAVINPLPLPTILKQTAIAQLCQMTGNLGLAFIERTGELTNAQLLLTSNEQHQANAGLIGQAFEYGGWRQGVSHRGLDVWFSPAQTS